MTPNCRRVGHPVTQMQDVFLDAPAITLTLDEAQQRVGVSRDTCEGVLDALVDAGVLARTPHGEYLRHFPHRHGSRGQHAA